MDVLTAYQPQIALALLALLFVAFLLERYPPEVTATAAAALFIVLGLVPQDEVMAVFSNSAPITIAAMFVLSGALVRTGLLDKLAGLVIGRAKNRPVLAIAIFLGATIFASAFVNNTPVVLVLIPVVVKLAQTLGLAPTRLLIPLSYAAILGGTCTLIGTSTNLLIDGIATEAGLERFSIFEIAPVGICVAVAGGAMMLFLGRFLLPHRQSSDAAQSSTESDFLSEVRILEGSDLIGRKLGEAAAFTPEGVRVTGIRRAGQVARRDLADHELKRGDVVIVLASTSELLTLTERDGIAVGLKSGAEIDPEAKVTTAEAILTPLSTHARPRIADLAIGRRHGMRVLGAHRRHHIAGPDLVSARLRPADKLLLQGTPEGFDALAQSGDLLSVARPGGRAYRRAQAPIAVIALMGVVGLAAVNIMPIGILALIAVAAILVLRCIDNDEAWSSIDASILVLIFAMLIIGAGLESTGAVEMLVGWLVPFLQGLPPYVTLIAVYALASVLTEVVTNNAVAVVLTPLVIPLANQLGLDPRSFVVALMMAASASFATPIGYQTNTLVYGAGDYRFADFLKIGVPMNIFVGAVSIFAISIFFPL
ncbi:SLC13 family permease [Mesobaculum littorinae]|uniref:SLC13 family permease n=1 Tax=Mesobaculum littorinae TaxID=2486419 RepID=A0A438AEM6_9RHOB|nr:SLC13 family permease [Mesobaculum littorinae]RVV97065.1 SLC13 family permease [Mesobaculum littorinae]